MRLLVSAPINSLSFGNVSINILREFYKKNIDLAFFPIGDKLDFGAYDKIDNDFLEYIKKAASSRYEKFDKNLPSLKLWHINSSETRYTKTQTLLTFHEVSQLTPIEKNILNSQDAVLVTSNYTKRIFEMNGVNNVKFIPLAFDKDFEPTYKNYLPDKIHFGIIGKLEKRKNTTRIIKAWLKLFGNNNKYQLSCAISNPFLDKAKFQEEIMKVLENKSYNNINFIPYMQTNSEVNDFLNSIDIDLGGLSGGEGWNLPSFNATALGKWSVVLNATAHKDWANKENSILIEPSRLKDCYDGVFFSQGAPFNQGQFFDLSDEEIEKAILKSVDYAKTPNLEGLKLQEKFTYESTASAILDAVTIK
jgi:glycosyltransferase involved in cell wall biosynthesis